MEDGNIEKGVIDEGRDNAASSMEDTANKDSASSDLGSTSSNDDAQDKELTVDHLHHGGDDAGGVEKTAEGSSLSVKEEEGSISDTCVVSEAGGDVAMVTGMMTNDNGVNKTEEWTPNVPRADPKDGSTKESSRDQESESVPDNRGDQTQSKSDDASVDVDSGKVSEMPQASQEKENVVQSPVEAVKTEKISAEETDTTEEVDVSNHNHLNSCESVKGRSDGVEMPTDELNKKSAEVTESKKPVVIFPNPEPDAKVVEKNPGVATSPKAANQMDGANANNNAKGQSSGSNRDNKTSAGDTKSAALINTKSVEKNSSKPDAPPPEIRERAGKSYSAQRSANRGSRKSGVPDPKSQDKQSTPRPTEGDAKMESRGRASQEEAVKAKGKQASNQGREKTASGGNRPKEPDRESEKKHSDHRRRDRDGTRDGKRTGEAIPAVKKPIKTKEEIEREEAEQKKKAEELKRAEEEKKAAEMKKQEEEEQRLLEEENTRLAEEEQKHAVEISTEANERKQAKMALRAKNLAAAAERPDEDFFVKLDSSMKKNTAFVRKLKTMTEQQRDSLTSEFNGLNLTKYVGEVATAIVESKFKMADISCTVHICSLMHQRYAEFSAQLQLAIQKCHPAQAKKDDPKESKKEPVVFDSRIRVELRFLAELIVAGVFTEKEGLPPLNNLLSSVLKADKESHAHISIIISFLKHCGEDFAGLVPRRNRLLAEKFNLTLPSSEIFSAQRKGAYKSLLKDHYLSLTKHLLKEHRDLQNVERHNRRTLQTKGELSEERRKRYEEMQASYQKLLVNTSTYADLIDEVVPDLPEAEITQEERDMMALDYLGSDKSGAEFDFDTSLWEDEDTRTFHENLIDLRTMVPGILFKDSEKKASPDEKQEDLDKLGEDIVALEKTEGAEIVSKEEAEAAEMAPREEPEGATTEEDISVEDVETTSALEPEQEDTEEEEEEAEQVTNMSKKMLLDAYLQRLPQCVNRDFIDKAAIEFCMDLNTKINRRKLIKTLFNVPRTRLDLLPFYSRLVATLYPCMPDIGTELVEKLKADFRWHVRKKDQMMIETKIKTVRFIGELTKFKICSKSDTLQCVKFLLQDFRHHNIDMVCNLLDSCGRFLYRSSDSHLLTKALLELMMRKRSKLHLNERHSTMVENTFFYCNPPEVKQVEKKERPVIHQYIRKLIFRDLSKTTTEKILKQLRKMDWTNVEIKTYITKCLGNVWNVKFNNIHCVASLLAGLVPYHDDVGIQVVDAVLEDIRIGMEINHAKFNQRRVSTVKFLGELYNYRMVESAVIFKTLYSLIRFGITLDGAENPLDPPEHLFRLRLVCTLLDTCGQFFDRGTSKKKLDCFLVYFQQYIMYKRSLPIWNPLVHPFPLDTDNALADTLETLRPKLKICTTLEEANEAVAELEKEQVQKHGGVIQMAIASVNPQPHGSPQLGTITEGDETKATAAVEFTSITEDEEISDSDSELEGVTRRGSEGGGEGHTSNSQSQGHSQNTGDEEVADDQMALDSAGETEEEDTVTVLTGGPKLIKCEEDDDFTAEFDKMLSESVQQRTVDTIKVPQQEIAIPAQARPRPKKIIFDIFNPDNNEDDNEAEQQADSVNFVLMMRRGNKQHYHEFEVPKSSDLAANLRNRERLELAEKQRLKELTLTINDRQEEEDYQEMMAQFQKPATVVTPMTPKERKPKFHHPKGAPDADQIFNSSGNRKW
ncbi:regulator of nonsense transcripts 2-like [Acanthaster planci]|uniref:Regulator of nonsense transcripts 2 n=1 Tax=Acanthaster planci TaxID=133434 RepID=A0A8B7Z1C9_ACAPL|nr:regulator of nonsense transcripts 2-like [Acanthaster planci]